MEVKVIAKEIVGCHLIIVLVKKEHCGFIDSAITYLHLFGAQVKSSAFESRCRKVRKLAALSGKRR